MNPDFIDFIASLLRMQARFLVIGAHALGAHGVSRATNDMDVWIDKSVINTDKVWNSLIEFGAPIDELRISKEDLQRSDMVVQFGLPPHRIDVLTGISGVTFEEAWGDRLVVNMHGMDIPFIGRDAYIKNKRASGRYKDLGDIESLGEKV